MSLSLTFPGQRQPYTYFILLKTGLDLTLKNGFLDEDSTVAGFGTTILGC